MASRRPTIASGKARPRASAPIRKPMATARRVSLFEREVTTRLSSVGVDLLLGAGTVLSEGTIDGARFAGSTMITVDLTRTAAAIAEPADAATAKRLAALVPTDDRARDRARRIAVGEARRTACSDLDAATVDLRVRAVGAQLHLDLDLEAVRRP